MRKPLLLLALTQMCLSSQSYAADFDCYRTSYSALDKSIWVSFKEKDAFPKAGESKILTAFDDVVTFETCGWKVEGNENIFKFTFPDWNSVRSGGPVRPVLDLYHISVPPRPISNSVINEAWSTSIFLDDGKTLAYHAPYGLIMAYSINGESPKEYAFKGSVKFDILRSGTKTLDIYVKPFYDQVIAERVQLDIPNKTITYWKKFEFPVK